MKDIQMVDILGQYEKIQEKIDRAVLDVIRSSAYINGPEVKSFQAELEEYLQVRHVIPCANGTDALQIAMMGLGLKPGDEVITASFTYVATAEVIALLGLTPVLVDVDPDSFLIDPKAVENAITPRTKAIVPVHLFGQTADMAPLMDLAEKHNLFIVEDTAQAIGARYRYADGREVPAGTIGHVGATSFFPSKNLGCFGDGGAMCTQDDELATQLRMIANHGQSKRYYHDQVGVNSRLDSIQAAILRQKLPHLDDYNSRRRAAADFYDRAFAGVEQIQTPVRVPHSTHVFHQYTLKVPAEKRDGLQAHLKENGIPAMIYYPVALHMQKAYRDDRYPAGHFPVTEDLINRVISLPMHTELTEDQLKKITSKVLSFINQ